MHRTARVLVSAIGGVGVVVCAFYLLSREAEDVAPRDRQFLAPSSPLQAGGLRRPSTPTKSSAKTGDGNVEAIAEPSPGPEFDPEIYGPRRMLLNSLLAGGGDQIRDKFALSDATFAEFERDLEIFAMRLTDLARERTEEDYLRTDLPENAVAFRMRAFPEEGAALKAQFFRKMKEKFPPGVESLARHLLSRNAYGGIGQYDLRILLIETKSGVQGSFELMDPEYGVGQIGGHFSSYYALAKNLGPILQVDDPALYERVK